MPSKYYRTYHLRRKYGISQQDYDILFKAQKGKCAICGRPPTAKGLVVDHDHREQHIRGLLCLPCNGWLGIVEKHDWVNAALRYLGETACR